MKIPTNGKSVSKKKKIVEISAKTSGLRRNQLTITSEELLEHIHTLAVHIKELENKNKVLESRTIALEQKVQELNFRNALLL